MALPDRGARRDADHDVRELPPGRLAHPQPAQLDGRLSAADRGQRRRLGLGGTRSISTSTLTRISRAAASSTSTATKSAAAESAQW